MFHMAAVAAVMKAINEALDLTYNNQYFLVNPQTNTTRPSNTFPAAHFCKMEEYVTSPIPMREATKLEILFKNSSQDQNKWHIYFPANKLTDLCGNIKGTISVDPFCGKQSKLLGIITEVDIGIFPQDRIRVDMEAELEEALGAKSMLSVKTGTMRYSNNNKSQKVLFIYRVTDQKSSATGFLTAYVLLKDSSRSLEW